MIIEIRETLYEEVYQYIVENVETISFCEHQEWVYTEVEFDTNSLYNREELGNFLFNLNWMII